MTTFLNAQKQHRKHPFTFWVPSMQELAKLEKGMHIKVATGQERFWIELTKIDTLKNKLTGFIDNDLVCTQDHGLEYGELITVGLENILNTRDFRKENGDGD